MIIERSITGGNAQTADGPLTQLDGFVEQLLKQDRPVQNNTNDPARQPRPGRYIPPRQEPQEPVQNPQQRVPNNTNDQARGNPQQFEQPVQNTGQPVQNPQRRVPNNTNDPARGNPQQLGQPVQNTGQPVQNSPAKNPMLKDPLSKAPLRRHPADQNSAAAAESGHSKSAGAPAREPNSAAGIQCRGGSGPIARKSAARSDSGKQDCAPDSATDRDVYTRDAGSDQERRQDQDEDIHRKVFLVFDSKDKQYLDNVQKPCDEALITIGAALAQNTAATPDMTKKLSTPDTTIEPMAGPLRRQVRYQPEGDRVAQAARCQGGRDREARKKYSSHIDQRSQNCLGANGVGTHGPRRSQDRFRERRNARQREEIGRQHRACQRSNNGHGSALRI